MSTDNDKPVKAGQRRREAEAKAEARIRRGQFGFHPDILAEASPCRGSPAADLPPRRTTQMQKVHPARMTELLRRYTARVEQDGQYWLITVPEIDRVTQARSLGEVETMARELIAVTLDIPMACTGDGRLKGH